MKYAPRSAYGKALALATKADESPLDLAENLWYVHYKDQLHKNAIAKVPNSLSELIKETGISPRRAYYLIDLWSRFSDAEISKSKLAEVGWTKLAILAKKCPAGKEQWGVKIALSKGVTAKNLSATLESAAKVKKTRCVLLYFDLHDYGIFEEALQEHGAKLKGKGLSGKEKAIMAMIVGAGAAS